MVKFQVQVGLDKVQQSYTWSLLCGLFLDPDISRSNQSPINKKKVTPNQLSIAADKAYNYFMPGEGESIPDLIARYQDLRKARTKGSTPFHQLQRMPI